MKSILTVFAITLIGATSFAYCPNLTGSYRCQNEARNIDMDMRLLSISTMDADYLTQTFDVGTSVEESITYILNVGKQSSKDRSGDLINYRAFCGGNGITFEVNRKLSESQRVDVKFKMSQVTPGLIVLEGISSSDPLFDVANMSLVCKKTPSLD